MSDWEKQHNWEKMSTMNVRFLRQLGHGGIEEPEPPETLDGLDLTSGWIWIDIDPEGDIEHVIDYLTPLSLDALALRDALEDLDAPKFDDFGTHLLLILHGLKDDAVATYEVDCFLTDDVLVTIHHGRSPSIEALWARHLSTPEVGVATSDEVLARLADVLTRRLASVVDHFDQEIDGLIDAALSTSPHVLESLTAVRTDVATVRRVAVPQREALDAASRSDSPLISPAGHRRLSDAFDVAARSGHGLDAARAALSETLDAYRGAEARQATEVSKVLTIYAAIMLPLTLIVGFFGMNFEELPMTDRSNGWVLVSIAMGVVATLSLGMFIGAGWMRRPSGRSTGRALGKGLIEAALAPVELVGSVLVVPGSAARSAGARRRRRRGGAETEASPSDRAKRVTADDCQ